MPRIKFGPRRLFEPPGHLQLEVARFAKDKKASRPGRPCNWFGRGPLLHRRSLAARRDFLRLALLLWITPDLAALSKAELILRYAAFASSLAGLDGVGIGAIEQFAGGI